jgi:integrase/recombinase XerD
LMLPSPIPEKEDLMGKPRSKPGVVRVSGPLAPYAGEVESSLIERGYTWWTRAAHLRVMAHLSSWLQVQQLDVQDLSPQRIEAYLEQRRCCGYTGFGSRRSLTPMLDALASLGLLPVEEPPAPASRTDVLLGGFARYLREERGLASCTVQAYLSRARRFLADYSDDGDLRGLTSADVSAAVLRESAAVSVGSVQYFGAALRSLLRYGHVAGLIEADLSAAVLPVTGRRCSPLPKGISPADARALLGSCDRRTALGRRDYAVILTLLRLGLRSCEVAALRLEDLDWRAGQMLVHGKGRRVERLPIPDDVGAAVTAYLRRSRPGTTRREVFLTTRAPRTNLSPVGVSFIVRRACVRAGLAPFGAHRLRHSLACEMVRVRVPLGEIGQILRHEAVSSTALYARVDVDQLRAVAQPWPDGAGR